MFTTVASRWKQRSSQVSDGVADGDKSKDIPRSWLCGKLVRDEPLVSVLPPAFNREAFVNNVGDPRPFKPTNGAGLLASPTPDRPTTLCRRSIGPQVHATHYTDKGMASKTGEMKGRPDTLRLNHVHADDWIRALLGL